MSATPGLFFTGTDTAVGKTTVAAAVARILHEQGRRVGVLKPVATGARRVGEDWRCEDAEALIAAVGGGISTERVAPLAFEPPLAPPVAARLGGDPLTWDRLAAAVSGALDWWEARGVELMIVEGVGGLLCPLAEEGATVADLALRLDYPLVVVARRGLGTLNHTLLTVEAARSRGLRLAGVVLNGAGPTADPLAEATNPPELSRHLGTIPLLADVPHRGGVAATPHVGDALWNPDLHGVDWFGRALPPRPLPGAAAGPDGSRS